eukprot:GHVQ01038549.1.p1 GENE.GHVQ01038549.1~~GHVQ01038549.1.p1  ORF type:complete len:260 (+),score=27.14 GHVQ01038549.1:641-1420(+)
MLLDDRLVDNSLHGVTWTKRGGMWEMEREVEWMGGSRLKQMMEMSGKSGISHVVEEISNLRKTITAIGKQYASQASTAESAIRAQEIEFEAVETLNKLLLSGVPILRDFRTIQKTLKTLPLFDPQTPMTVLVGAPNVGKSALAKRLSEASPQVDKYPFTTPGLVVGRVSDGSERKVSRMSRTDRWMSELGKFVDAPALLDRSDSTRSTLELFTVSRDTLGVQWLSMHEAVLFLFSSPAQCAQALTGCHYLRLRRNKHLW